jgi:hypothetical protein
MLSAFHAKVYCGGKDVPPDGRKFGTVAQCKKLRMLRRYGNITVLHPITAAKRGANICTGATDYTGVRKINVAPSGAMFVYKYDRDGTCRGRKRIYRNAKKMKCIPTSKYADYIASVKQFRAVSSDPEALQSLAAAGDGGRSLFTPAIAADGYMPPPPPGAVTTADFQLFRGPASDPEALQGVNDASAGDHGYGDQTLITPMMGAGDYDIPPQINANLGVFHGPASDPQALQDLVDDQMVGNLNMDPAGWGTPPPIHPALGVFHE